MKIKCPFCGSKNVELTQDVQFHCKSCERLFDGNDIQREILRHRLSPLLSGTSEESPKEVDVTIGEEEAVGLSSLELPVIDGVFLFEDGTMWYHIKNAVDCYGDKLWEDIDNLDIADLRSLVLSLENAQF